MKRLSINDLSKIPSVPEEVYEIKEWDVSVLIRGMTKGMQVKLGKLLNSEGTDAFDYQKELLKVCIVEPELTDEDIDMLYSKDSKVIDKIFIKINELNGLGGSAEADKF